MRNIDEQIDYIEDEIDIRIESLKEQLNKLGVLFKNKLGLFKGQMIELVELKFNFLSKINHLGTMPSSCIYQNLDRITKIPFFYYKYSFEKNKFNKARDILANFEPSLEYLCNDAKK